jgi:formate/nitrite transporter FocA (FNT family)
MDYVNPADVANAMVETGSRKLALPTADLLVRGILSGALLGVATSLAFTGAFFHRPAAGRRADLSGRPDHDRAARPRTRHRQLRPGAVAMARGPRGGRRRRGRRQLGWVFLGNLIGSIAYGALIVIALTDMGAIEPAGVAARLVAAAEAKTTGYAAYGFAGFVTVFVKGLLCNWMVCLAVVLAMSTTSTVGKIACAWMPVFVFFAQGFEHSVVNMFIIPTGMMMGAKVSVADWWLWNQIPVTLGNLVGGFCFTGFALYITYRPRAGLVRMGGPAPAPAE